jgi:hypothetical protein
MLSDVPGRSIGVMKRSSSSRSFPSVVPTLLIFGYRERCLSFGCAIVGLLPGPFSSLIRLPPDSSEKDLKAVGLSARCCDKEFVTMAGGRRLILLSPAFLTSNCFASIRLWAAKASSGESDGGTSPSLYTRRGERIANLEDESPHLGLRSMKLGLSPIVSAQRS